MGAIRLMADQDWALVEVREGNYDADPASNPLVPGFPRAVTAGLVYDGPNDVSLFWKRENYPGDANSGLEANYHQETRVISGTEDVYIK